MFTVVISVLLNTCVFVFVQEELAFVFEMLQQFEDALVQYDELDALFTQYVLNFGAGGILPTHLHHILTLSFCYSQSQCQTFFYSNTITFNLHCVLADSS